MPPANAAFVVVWWVLFFFPKILSTPAQEPRSVELGAVHEAKVWSMCTLETQNATAVIGRNFSSALSERDFSLERLGQVVLSVRKMHAGGGIRSAKVDIRHIDPSRCATSRHRRAHTFLRAHSVSPQTAILHSPERPPDSVLTISCTRLAGPRPTSRGLH